MRSRRIPLSAKEIANWIRRAANRDSGRQKIASLIFGRPLLYSAYRESSASRDRLRDKGKKEERRKEKEKPSFTGDIDRL